MIGWKQAGAGFVLAAALSGTVPSRAELSPDGVSRRLRQIEDALAPHGLPLDPAAVERAVSEAALRTLDPGARLADEAARRAWEEDADAVAAHGGWRLSVSNGFPYVVDTLAGGAAAAAGIRAGDVIERLGDRELGGLELDAALAATRAPTATALRIGLRRGADATNVSLTLARGPLPAIETSEVFPQDIGYVRLNALRPGTAAELLRTVGAWATAKVFGVILDMRGAAGGDEESARALAGAFAVRNEPLGSWKDSDGVRAVAPPAGGAKVAMPLMVLADRRTRGAAELLAAMAAGSLRGAMVVGEVSAGDPLLRRPLALAGGGFAIVAVRRFAAADGRTYAGGAGVEPDIRVDPARPATADYEPSEDEARPVTLDEERVDRSLRDRLRGDEALQRAVDILLGLRALHSEPDAADNPPG